MSNNELDPRILPLFMLYTIVLSVLFSKITGDVSGQNVHVVGAGQNL